ncbi:hypothetical protein Tco_0012297 [Tanacetum coccineum]
MASEMVLNLQVAVVVVVVMSAPQGIHVWIERFNNCKACIAFRSAATPAEAEDWITHMEKLFQVLGCPDNFKTRLAAFKLEGDALSWWKAHLRTQVGGDAFADTCTWVAFREIFYNRLASFVGTAAGDAPRQARHFKWGLKKWVLDRIVNTEYTNVAQCAAAARNIELLHESGNSNKRDRDGNRIQNRGQGQQENRGRHDQGQHEYRGRQDQNVEHRGRQDRGYDSRRQDFRSGSRYPAKQRSLLRLCLSTSLYSCGKASSRWFVIRLQGDVLLGGLTQPKVKDFPKAKHEAENPTDFADCLTTTRQFMLRLVIRRPRLQKHNMNPTPLIERIIISTPMKNHMLIDHEYVNCPLRFDDRIRPANLLPIHNATDFDVEFLAWIGWLLIELPLTAMLGL